MSRDALVVGISTYQCLPSLNAPSHDAEAIAQRLQTDGDFRVARMPEIVQAGQSRIGFKTQVTVAELEAALIKLFKPKGTNVPQTALFYFSGHGLQKDAGVQEGFLATSDANPNAGFYGLSLFWLRRLLQESPVRQRIVLLDCCHSGELLNFLEADPGARSGTDRLFMAASREYEAAYESMIGKYSVFTQALLEGLDPTRVANGTVTNYALTDWVSNALKREMQQPLFENSGSEILLTRGQGAPTSVKTELVQDVCPYRGLEFFDEAHADYYFGREELTDQLIEKLRTGNFAAVVGASGSGKSSLVRAGLIHTLRQGKKFSGSDRWRIQLISPTEQPLKSLATAFVNPKDSAVDRAEQLRRAETLLRDGGTGLSHLIRASLMSAKHGRNSRLLLIIDQFEEVFTLCQGLQAERDRLNFFHSLITALRELNDCFSVVVVLRADFFGKYSLYNGLAKQIEQNLITVTPLTYQQIKASIVKPAEKAGIICEPNLIYNILLDVVGAPGELPLLQYTLLELWQRRQLDPEGGAAHLTLDAYNELGGVRGTLQKRADDLFYSLTPEEQRVAKRIFIALTQIGDGTEDTRRRISKSELISPWFPAALIEQVLEKLVAAKLVVTNRVLCVGTSQRRVIQEFNNVSTALRFAQMRRGKCSQELSDDRAPSILFSNSTNFDIASLTQRSVSKLSDASTSVINSSDTQETVDVAHEALIRNWTLLRTWLDENRELLQRQRRMEQAAKEWYALQQSRSPEYLLHGDRLTDAEDYVIAYPDELSALAQRYIAVSREENRRAQKERRLLQLAVPCTLLVALVVTFSQYRAVVNSQAEKDYQLQIATARQQAAVAQAILQEPDGDPTTALLISRLAAEKGGYTYEAQASLRTALQKLRLQVSLQGHRGAVHQAIFSPNQRQLATAGADGTIRLWSLETQAIEKVFSWRDAENPLAATAITTPNAPTATAIVAIAFSPDGTQLAAIAQNSADIQLWSVASGKRLLTLNGLLKPVQQITFSPKGDWLAASAGNEVRVWDTRSGQPQATLRHVAPVNSLTASPSNRALLTTSGNNAQLWQRHPWQVSSWQRHKLLRHDARVRNATFSPNGKLIATAADDGSAYLWRVNTGQLRQILTAASSTMPMQGSSLRSFEQAVQPLKQVMFSPNGQLLATVDASCVRLWNVNSGQLWQQLERSSELNNANLAGQTDRSPGSVHYPRAANSLAFSPNSRQLVIADHLVGDEDTIPVARLWDLSTGQLIGSLKGHSSAIETVQFSRNGSLIATASTDGSTRLWATEMGSEFPTLNTTNGQRLWAAFGRLPGAVPMPPLNTATIAHASFRSQTPEVSPLEGFGGIVTVAIDGTINTWNPTKPAAVSDKARIASESAAPLWSPARLTNMRFDFRRFFGASMLTLKVPEPAIAPSGRLFSDPLATPVTVAANNLATAESSTAFKPLLQRQVLQAANAHDASNGLDSVVATPHVAYQHTPKRPSGIPTSAKLTAVAFSADTQWIAIAPTSGTVEVWQRQPDQSLQRVRRLEANKLGSVNAAGSTNQAQPHRLKTIYQLAFSPDNQTLLGVSDDRVITLWDVPSGKVKQQLQGHAATIEQVQFSADSQRVVSASRDRTARLWHVASGQLVTTLYHRDVISSARFSPNGHLVAIASWDGTARILNARTGVSQVIMTGHRGAVLDAEFSPDATRLVTASADGTIRLWDAKTGTEQALLRPAELGSTAEPIQQAFFSPDGRYVASLSKSGQLRLWAATWEELLHLARDRTLRQLQPEECLRYLRLSPHACPSLEVSSKG
ncbi:caspase family protein [Phormidium sp. FACHB-592]|uniref:Caspase family protein n=1 Tax=Stenomitos frigidus AS-A4 TaxID=2933935 RepID=A0ABV0KDK1_9CYAN|nr:caspase family protein [Phormidium sp. FACHB-592]MBD2075923.1 caspase family protein [Phormidium sp. FACHB-592]